MKVIWKIFELVEISSLDQWSDLDWSHHITQEWEEEFASEEDAFMFLQEISGDLIRARQIEIKKIIIVNP